MKRLFAIAGFLFLFSIPARANDVYYAQTALGGATGADCADAIAYNDATHGFSVAGNWSATPSGLQMGPGATGHICGTISVSGGISGLFTFQLSGTSGNPATLKMEVGSIITAPYWGLHGAIYGNSQNFINILGPLSCGATAGLISQTPCSATVTTSANGTGLANQSITPAIVVDGSANYNVEFINVTNNYVHAPSDAITGFSVTGSGPYTVTASLSVSWPCQVGEQFISVQGISSTGTAPNVTTNPYATITACPGGSLSGSISYSVSANPGTYTSGGWIADEAPGLGNVPDADGITFLNSGSNGTITGIYAHDEHWCISGGAPGSSTIGNLTVSNNVTFNCDHGLALFDGNSNANLNGLSISGNIDHDHNVWDDQSPGTQGSGLNLMHHDSQHFGPVHSGSVWTSVYVYGNWDYGNPGRGTSAWIFFSGTNAGTSTSTGGIFNNAVDGSNASNFTADGMITSFCGSASTACIIANNTVLGSCITLHCGVQTLSQVAFQLFQNSTIVGPSFQNNICSTLTYCFYIGSSSPGPLISASDYNLAYNVLDVAGIAPSSFYKTMALYSANCTATPCPAVHDTNSQASMPNPLLNLTSVPTLQLSGLSSPAHNAGVNLTSLGITALNSDALLVARPASGAWDQGAFQVVTPPTILPVVPSKRMIFLSANRCEERCQLANTN